MAAGHCRLDDGQQSSATNCFPARTLLGRRKDGRFNEFESFKVSTH